MYSSVPPTPPSCLGRLLLPLAPTSCLRTKAYGKALKKLRAVHTHFIDIIEDQVAIPCHAKRLVGDGRGLAGRA